MYNLHIINYNDFTADELCHYLEERHYPQILTDFKMIERYIDQLVCSEDDESSTLIHAIFHKLETEVKQLFTKDKILLFPYIINHQESSISLQPINQLHQRILGLLQRMRGLLNNYVQQPEWSSNRKICSNELYALEQSIQRVLYIKENYLWTKIDKVVSHEY
ncbi:MAG TPA: hypothetical protein PLA16_10835 [Chitinophagales bacterium]|jgi:iron-sulfur cluster repair protein YtfE (RIC family)|nr:hypothetical protein [Chitinophagales bacterium]